MLKEVYEVMVTWNWNMHVHFDVILWSNIYQDCFALITSFTEHGTNDSAYRLVHSQIGLKAHMNYETKLI